MHATFVFLGLIANVMAAPATLAERQDAATVIFTPYKYVGCRQSEDPYSPDKPTTFTVTSGTCFTPSYTFQSYVESTNFNVSSTPCALSIFPEPNCGGQGIAATLSEFAQCVANQAGASFELECGP